MLRSDINLIMSLVDRRSADFAEGVQSISRNFQSVLENGTLANQADLLFADDITIAASGTLDLDLNGSLTSPALGAAVNFLRVRGIIIKAAVGNTNNVIMGGAPSNGFFGPFQAATERLNVRPGGTAMLLAPSDSTGWVVTPATGDILRFANSGAGSAVNFELYLIGASA
jgi:hypothetical protein